MGQAQQKRRAVLVVEDDAELRYLTAALFEDEKVDTIECESAEAALAVMLIGGREVAMIFADVRLSRPARAFWQPSNVQATVASFSRPVYGRVWALMPPGFPARLQANADRLGRARNHVRSRSRTRRQIRTFSNASEPGKPLRSKLARSSRAPSPF